MKNLSGGVAPYMMGLIAGIAIVSTLSANKASLDYEKNANDYIEQKKQHLNKISQGVKAKYATEELTSDSTIVSSDVTGFVHTNVFNSTNLDVQINQGTQADGKKTAILSISENEYEKNQALTSNANDALLKDFTNQASVSINEADNRDVQSEISFNNMKKQAEIMYNSIAESADKKFPCTLTSYKKDAWNRDFNYQRVDDFNAKISFKAPWDNSIEKSIDLKLPVLPDNSVSIKQISNNYNKLMILTSNNDLYSVGYNRYGSQDRGRTSTRGEGDLVVIETGVDSIVYNSGNSAIIKKLDNTLSYVGINHKSIAGNNDTANVLNYLAYPVPDLKTAAVANYTAALLQNNGDVWMVGENATTSSLAGLNDTVSANISIPTKTPNLSNIKEIYSSSDVSFFAIDNSDRLYATGRNNSGKMGLGHTNRLLEWTYLGVDNVEEITPVGYTNLFVKKKDGTLWAAGANAYYQLGIGNSNNQQNTMFQIPGIPSVKKFYTNSSSSYIITDDGSLFVAGDNRSGELGLGNAISYQKTFADTGLDNIVDVDVLPNKNAMVINSLGELFVTGKNLYGSLGVGHENVIYNWQKVTGLDPIKKTYLVHSNFSFILTTTGKVYATGYNLANNLGIGTGTNVLTWLDLGFTDVKQVYVDKTSGDVSYIQTNSDELYGAGENSDGNIGLGTYTSNEIFWVKSIGSGATELGGAAFCP